MKLIWTTVLGPLLAASVVPAWAQEVDCSTFPIGGVIRARAIERSPHVSTDPSLSSQPIFLERGGTANAYVTLLSRLSEDSPTGIQGFVVGVAVEGNATVLDASFEGTAGDDVPEGISSPPLLGGAEVIEPGVNSQGEGAVASLVFSFSDPVWLPRESAADVLRITLAAPDSEEPQGGIVFRDGLVGSGQPVLNEFSVAGETQHAGPPEDPLRCLAGTTIRRPLFRRGDADQNGRVELTDGVHIHRHLFVGDPPRLECRDAADVDDDGRINLTDGIRVFLFLFRGGVEPPPPFGECGEDPTPDDAVTCANFGPCQ